MEANRHDSVRYEPPAIARREHLAGLLIVAHSNPPADTGA